MAGSKESGVQRSNQPVIEAVTDLDAVWMELTALFLEFEAANQAFEPRELLPDWQDRWRQRLRLHEDRLILLARLDGDAVGCLISVIRRDEGLAVDTHGYLSYMFVRQPFRRSGVGSSLLAEAEAWCRLRGADRIELEVFSENAPGTAFWTQAGFRTQSLTMSRSLAGSQ